MSAATDTQAVRDLLDSVEPGCEMTEHHSCGRPDRECHQPAAWIERWSCICDTDGQLLACTGHHNLLPILIRDQICNTCGGEPVLIGAEPL